MSLKRLLPGILFFTITVLVAWLFSPVVNAQSNCSCEYSICGEDAFRCSDPSNPNFWYVYSLNTGSCTGSDMCSNPLTGPILCSSCPFGYGDINQPVCPGPINANMCPMGCVASCAGIGGGGGGCDKMGRITYACNPSNTNSLIFQAWQDNNEYNPSDPNSTRANHIKYVSNVTFKSPPGAFCTTWYTEQFTGYIWLEEEKEFKLYTDLDTAVSGKPTNSQCCPGSASNCGKCEKRWSLATGCGSKTNLNRCVNTLGCQWVVWNQSRCSDDYSDNTGLKIGYVYDPAKGKNVPVGEITDTGDPTGLTTVIRSGGGTSIAAKRFDGNGHEFEPGWYPIQAWYTRSNGDDAGWSIARDGGVRIPNVGFPIERSDNEHFRLLWRDPSASGSFEDVPSTSFVPCLGGVVCGSNPGAATAPISPADSATDVDMPVTLTWTAPANWGDTCGVQTNTYTVYANIKPVAGDCLDPSPADYTALPACTNVPEGTTTCSDPFFNVRDTEFCWYVVTNNGEFTTNSAATGADVWWFETTDPITYQEWMTTLYGDFYAGSVMMDFPDFGTYVAPWDPPHITYESGVKVPAISSNDIDIKTDNPKLGINYYPESQSQFYVKYADFTQTWPANYRGDPPSDAVSLPRSGESCDDIFIHNASGNSPALEPGEAYKASVSCVQDGLDNYGGDYRNQNPGVAVLYVTGNGDLRFNNEFLTSNDNYRVLFVTGPNVDVKIDRSLSSGNPTLASTPLIEAAFVINKSIEFEGVPVGTDPETDPDTSIVVEGPVIARSTLFARNRGLTNFYPSEIIKYNGDYIYKLTKQELDSNEGNYTGLFVVDVDWISEE